MFYARVKNLLTERERQTILSIFQNKRTFDGISPADDNWAYFEHKFTVREHVKLRRIMEKYGAVSFLFIYAKAGKHIPIHKDRYSEDTDQRYATLTFPILPENLEHYAPVYFYEDADDTNPKIVDYTHGDALLLNLDAWHAVPEIKHNRLAFQLHFADPSFTRSATFEEAYNHLKKMDLIANNA
jgi:hypothetical protein